MKPFVSVICQGEQCYCGAPAEHKVEQVIFHDDPTPHRHPLTRYVCHPHFREIMGPAADRRQMMPEPAPVHRCTADWGERCPECGELNMPF